MIPAVNLNPGQLIIPVNISRGRIVNISVPADITPVEYERICQFLTWHQPVMFEESGTSAEYQQAGDN